MIKKIVLILLVILVILGAITYIDYFLAKSEGTLPKLVIKKEDEVKQMTIHNGLFYKAIYCYADKSVIYTDHKSSTDVCPRLVTYDEKGYFTNSSGLKISKRDYTLMSYLNIYTFDTIDNIENKEDVKNYSYVSYEYGLSRYIIKEGIEIDNNGEKVQLAIFPTFVETEGEYSFVYDEANPEKKYCTKTDETGVQLFSKYDEETKTCIEEFTKITMKPKWCELYKYSTLVYSLDEKLKYCE